MKNNLHLGQWFIGFGFFLMVCGIIGFASNPTAAKTALLSGGTFGLLNMFWGVMMKRGGGQVPLLGAGVTTVMLCAAFTWRAFVTWHAVSRSEPKMIAALLISAMLVASVCTLFKLIKFIKA